VASQPPRQRGGDQLAAELRLLAGEFGADQPVTAVVKAQPGKEPHGLPSFEGLLEEESGRQRRPVETPLHHDRVDVGNQARACRQLAPGVSRACRYEPELNPTYQDLAVHYGVAVMPARVRKPRDKAKVEAGVQLVQRWILARLRHRRFFSLHELNQAIRELLGPLNDRPFRKLPGSRRSLFDSVERPALRPLPGERFTYAEWKKARVHIDYHVEVDGHYYSVPYQLVSQELDVRMSAKTVECFAKSKRVASHLRSFRRGAHTTQGEHMPRPHREYAEWTPERLVRWAQTAGPSVAGLIATVMSTRVHPQQGFRSCLGILRLSERYGGERLEAACQHALQVGAASYRSVRSILLVGLDRQQEQLVTEPAASRSLAHENLRGASYYRDGGQPC
jgi:transposase